VYISLATTTDRKTACSAVSHEEQTRTEHVLRLSAWLDNFADVPWRRRRSDAKNFQSSDTDNVGREVKCKKNIVSSKTFYAVLEFI